MSSATATNAPTEVDFINPIIKATKNVFDMMLGCDVSRTGLELRGTAVTGYGVSAGIGLTGPIHGTIVLSFTDAMALKILDQIVGITATEINHEVCDAVGELANMVAGSAKAQLADLNLSLGIPNVVIGEGHAIHFPSNVIPFRITFTSGLGDFAIEAGFTKADA